MKKIIILSLFFCCSFFSVLLAAIAVQPYTLNWQTTGLAEDKDLTFEDAIYFDDTRLPYFYTAIPCESYGNNIDISVGNVQFAELTVQEKNIVVADGITLPTEILPDIRQVTQDGKQQYRVFFLPLILKDGKYQKVVSFDLNVTSIADASKKASGMTTSSSIHSFASSSVMNTGKWVKIRIPSTGVYKVTYDEIVSYGLNPNNIQVFGYGGAMLNEEFFKPGIDDLPQVAFYMNKGGDGVFNSGDYILFFGQGPVSVEYADDRYKHTVNPYSMYGYYFLASDVWGLSQHTIPLSATVNGAGSTTITKVMDYALYDPEVSGSNVVNLIATLSGRNGSGRDFYGEEFSLVTKSRNFTLNIPNVVAGSDATLEFSGAVSGSDGSSGFVVSTGGTSQTINATKPKDAYVKATTTNSTFTFNPSAQNTVNVTLNNSGSSVKGWLNYICITAQRELVMNGKAMVFTNAGSESVQLASYMLRNANSNIKIWDVTDPANIKEIPATYNSGNLQLMFVVNNPDGVLQRFVAVDVTASFSSVTKAGDVSNQNLHGISFNPDLVIVCYPEFLPSAQRLVEAHQQKDNLSAVIVTPAQVYNEFSSGTPDATAIRKFMKMFYERKNNGTYSNRTKYLLLFGDGSYDNRQMISSPDGNNKIITFQSYNSLVDADGEGRCSYVTDDYFGFLDDSEGKYFQLDKMDIGIGRFPVNTVEEADNVVNKTIRYMDNNSKGSWKNELCFFADDADNVLDKYLVEYADKLADKMIELYPEFQSTKLYLDAYKQQTTASNESYPEAREKLHYLIKRGLLMLNYTGHGGMTGWTSEKVMTNQDILNMYNDNLALWVTATCDFSRFDSGITSAGENVLLNPKGGGIALLTTSRTVYASSNDKLNMELASHIFSKDDDGKRLRLGEIIRRSKQNMNDVNKLNFVLLGDPALVLQYPAYKISTDFINGVDAYIEEPTLGALSKVTLNGHVMDDDQSVLTGFNGIVSITILDKEEDIRTLNNNGNGVFTYKDRSTIFSGKAEVVDGRFTMTFMIPKDINYVIGKGKIIYYAYDDTKGYEAHGYYDNFNIGGSSEDYIDDNEGPKINMYLNESSFMSGDKVNDSPLFVARVSDENGINVIGNGIGHDITLMLDNQRSTVLNEYYEPDLGTYQSGTVNYKIPNLPDGKYTLTFRVWDLLNNSSTDSFEFEVGTNMKVAIIDTYCYPNPASSSTAFVLKHDRPDDLINVAIHFYDLTGAELWTYDSEFYTTGNLLYITEWDLKMNSGQRVQPGVYLFKLEVTSDSGKMSTKTKKMIVNAQ